MHTDYLAILDTLQQQLERTLADLTHELATPAAVDDLVLEQLPNGEHAWLRPRPADDVRYVLTDPGRHVIAEAS